MLLVPLFVFSTFTFVFAQGRPLEITYPELFGTSAPQTVNVNIAQYFRYVYYTILAISGLLALGALFYAGFRYLTSVGSPAALQDAKDQIFAALFGMLILFGSWLVLYTINPQLVALQQPILRPSPTTLAAGIWLCKEETNSAFQTAWQRMEEFRAQEEELKRAANEQEKERITNRLKELIEIIKEQMEEINKKCYLAGGSGGIRGDFARSGNYVTHAYSVPKVVVDAQTGNRVFTIYSGVVFEKPNFEGKAKILWDSLLDLAPRSPVGEAVSPVSGPQSILTFNLDLNPQPAWQVIAYEEVDFNRGFSPGSKAEQVISAGCVTPPVQVHCEPSLGFSPKSLRMTHTAPGYIAILSKYGDYTDPKIIIASEANLLGYNQIVEWDCFLGFFRCTANPAAKHIFLASAKIY